MESSSPRDIFRHTSLTHGDDDRSNSNEKTFFLFKTYLKDGFGGGGCRKGRHSTQERKHVRTQIFHNSTAAAAAAAEEDVDDEIHLLLAPALHISPLLFPLPLRCFLGDFVASGRMDLGPPMFSLLFTGGGLFAGGWMYDWYSAAWATLAP